MAGIYCVDIYCSDCVEDIKDRIATELLDTNDKMPDGTLPPLTLDEIKDYLDSMDECEYDSSDYPKHCDDNEESDSPQHCGSGADCLDYSETSDGEKYGHFFGNNLTTEGSNYVKEAVDEALMAGRNGPAVELWMPCYDYINYIKPCATCGNYTEIDDNDEYSECATTPVDEDFTITPCGSLGEMRGG